MSTAFVPSGFVMAPVRDGEVIAPEDFEKLTDEEKLKIQEDVAELQKGLESMMREMPKHRSETRDKVRALTQEVVRRRRVLHFEPYTHVGTHGPKWMIASASGAS